MRASTFTAGAALFAASAYAQLPTQVLQIVSQLSPQCQSSVFGLVSSPAVECLNVAETIQIVSNFINNEANSSIIPPIDQLLSLDCSSAGCSNATISSAVSSLVQGCSSDLQKYNIEPEWISLAAQQYPLAREVICLRTNETASVLNATLTGSNSTTNETELSSENGTVFCATSLLSTLSEKVEANLTIPFFIDLYKAYQNNTIQQYAQYFNASDLCEECIFAAADVIGVAYPQIGNTTLASLGFGGNSTNSSTANATANVTAASNSTSSSTFNTTLAAALNSTCSAEGLSWNSNGTLPASISLGAENSTFGFALSTSNETFTPITPAEPIVIQLNSTSTANASASASASASARATPSVSAAAGRRNVADIKARWVGQI